MDSKCEKLFRKFYNSIRRIFLSASVSCSRANEQRITKNRWIELMSELCIVPDLIPRRVALKIWFLHVTKDLLLGPSLSYNDFRRSLVAIASSLPSPSRKKTSSDEYLLLLNLFVEMNRYRV